MIKHQMVRKKYNAKPTWYNGVKYPSMFEANFARYLDSRKEEGNVIGWLRQVPFYFSDGSKYVCDFEVFIPGEVHFVETKGRETTDYRRKINLLSIQYPWVDLVVVKDPRGKLNEWRYENVAGEEIRGPIK